MFNKLTVFFHKPLGRFLFVVVSLCIFILVATMWIKEESYNDLMKPIYTGLTPEQPERDIYIGFWTHGLWDDETKSLHPDRLEKLESEIGKKVAIANYFRGWQFLESENIIMELNTLSNSGWRPMVSANPYFFKDCTAPKGMTLYKAIWLGHCDELLHRIARNFKQVEKPFFLRFAWEMNVGSMEWSISETGSYPQEFINAWKRFHDIVKEEGATNVIWVFSPQVETPTTTDIAALYPGDDYVDWVALDGYNWGETRSWSNWQSFKDIFYKSYIKLHELAPSKPFMIAEVNTVDKGGDRGAWYKQMLSEEIPNDFPEIDAIVFFNEDKTEEEGINWLIDNTPTSLEQFKQGISSPIYKSKF